MNQVERPELVSIIQAPKNLVFAHVTDSGEIGTRPVALIGYSNWRARVFPDEGQNPRPTTRTWFARGLVHPMWEKDSVHDTDKRNGACGCDFNKCGELGIVDWENEEWRQRIAERATKRAEWLQKRLVRVERSKQYNQERKERLAAAVPAEHPVGAGG